MVDSAKLANDELSGTDQDTIESLDSLSDISKIQKNRVSGVKTILVVLSSRAMVFDMDSLRQKILSAYPDATVFFRNTLGRALGMESFKTVDLLIDFTGPAQRQGWFYARKLRKTARFAVGRNAGLFRSRLYDRVFDEKAIESSLPKDILDRELFVQKQVLWMAGVPTVPAADTTEDRARLVALDLPPLSQE